MFRSLRNTAGEGCCRFDALRLRAKRQRVNLRHLGDSPSIAPEKALQDPNENTRGKFRTSNDAALIAGGEYGGWSAGVYLRRELARAARRSD